MTIGSYTAQSKHGHTAEVLLRAALNEPEGDLPLSFLIKEELDKVGETIGNVQTRFQSYRVRLPAHKTRIRYPYDEQKDVAVRKQLGELNAERKRFERALYWAKARELLEPELRLMTAKAIAESIIQELRTTQTSTPTAKFEGLRVIRGYPETLIAVRFRTLEKFQQQYRVRLPAHRTRVRSPIDTKKEQDFDKYPESLDEKPIIWIDWERAEIRDEPRQEPQRSIWREILESLIVNEVITTILLGPVLKGLQIGIRLLAVIGRAALRIKGVERVASKMHLVATQTARRASLSRPALGNKAVQTDAISGSKQIRTARDVEDPIGRAVSGKGRPDIDSRGANRDVGRRGISTARRAGTVFAVSPAHAAEKKVIDEFVEEALETAAERAIVDPQFLKYLESGRSGITNAGTRFHKLAQEAVNNLAKQNGRLPEGFQATAEFTPIKGRGGSRLDVFIRTPSNRLFEYDWKTSTLSGLSKEVRSGEIPKHASAILSKLGQELAGQESRSWGPAVVRALRRAGRIDQLTTKQRNALRPWL